MTDAGPIQAVSRFLLRGLEERYAIASDVIEYGNGAESSGNLHGLHEGGAAQAHGLVEIRLKVVDNNGDGRMVGGHALHVLEDAAANPA